MGFLFCWQRISSLCRRGLRAQIDYFRQPRQRYPSKRQDYQSDVYTQTESAYYPLVVWQFWGRAAEAS